MNFDNVAVVAELERVCFPDNPWSLNSFIYEIQNPLSVYRTAYLAGALAGYIGMHHILDEGHITNIAVLPTVRGCGIAAALVENMLEYAQEYSIKFLTLEVRPSNRAAISLYLRHGFEPAGRRKNYYPNPPEDALLMTKYL